MSKENFEKTQKELKNLVDKYKNTTLEVISYSDSMKNISKWLKEKGTK